MIGLHPLPLLLGALILGPVLIEFPAPQDPIQEVEAEEGPHDRWLARLVDDGRPTRLDDLSGLTCAGCHQTITEEWRHSTHATAWIDPHYTKALKKIRRKRGCTGCHAPVPMLGKPPTKIPATRTENPHLGVTCTTCHLAADGETMLGPAGHANDGHPSEANELFNHLESNALCITCHNVNIGPVLAVAKDFKASDQAGMGDSCVGCHMPSINRAWANDEISGELGTSRPGRSHRLETSRDPAFLRGAMNLRAEFNGTGAVLVVTNLTGHRVPGLIGRELTLRFSLYNAEGQRLSRSSHTFSHRSHLPVDADFKIDIEGLGAAELRVSGTHKAPGIPKGIVFLERTFKR